MYPIVVFFLVDQHILDKTCYVLHSCNAQIYFGIGKKISSEKNLLSSKVEDLSSLLLAMTIS